MDLSTLTKKNILQQLYGNSFHEFVKYFWECCSQDVYQETFHTKVICDHLQLQGSGAIKHLYINAPPRFGKSILINVLYPIWRWLRKPSLRVISATYAQDLSVRDSMRARDLINHPKFQELYGDWFHITEGNDRKDFYTNNHKGARLAASISSRVQGFDAELITADDLATLDSSEGEREKAKNFFQEVLSSRLVWGSTDSNIILSGHRCSESDLYQWAFERYENDPDWTFLILPMEADPEHTNQFHNDFYKDTRPEGELLWKEVTTQKKVNELKREYRHRYDLIFNQKVVAVAGQLFNAAWFNQKFTDEGKRFKLSNGRYAEKSQMIHFGVVDLAITTKTYSDYTVFLEIWAGQGAVVISDMIREKVDGARIVGRIGGIVKMKNLQFTAIEDHAFQKILIGQLKSQGLVVKGVKPESDKQTRSIAAQILSESGQIYLPSECYWASTFINELVQFPNSGKNDDIVDCLSYGCILAQKYAGIIPEEPLTAEELLEKEKEEKRKQFIKLANHGTSFYDIMRRR